MVSEEDDPGAGVQSGFGKGVQYPADRSIGGRDRPVEFGQILPYFRRIEADNFQTVLIERKEDIWPSFKAFLAKDRVTDQQQ